MYHASVKYTSFITSFPQLYSKKTPRINPTSLVLANTTCYLIYDNYISYWYLGL